MANIGENMTEWNLYTLLLGVYIQVAYIKIGVNFPQKVKIILEYYMIHLFQRILNKTSLKCAHLCLLLFYS